MVELDEVYGMLAHVQHTDYIVFGLMTAGIYFALSYPASIFAITREGDWRMHAANIV